MREIRRTSQFRRDYRRALAGVAGRDLEQRLRTMLGYLLKDERLPQRYVDHALAGEWKDHRDCHIRPDLILIYRKPDSMSLELVRLGSHSELGF